MEEPNLCSYGCGRLAITKFKNGKCCCETSRNKCPSLRDLNRKGNTGRVHSNETKEKISKWNLGKKIEKSYIFNNIENILCDYGCGQLAKYKNSDKVCCSQHFSKCPTMIQKNRDRSLNLHKDPVVKEKLKAKVKLSWEAPDRAIKNTIGMKRFLENETDEHRASRVKIIRDSHRKKEYLSWMKNWGKENWKNPEYVKKIQKSQNLRPNKPETLLITIFKDLNLNFKYTGDFSFFIEGKNPDFINYESKKLIEFFGSYYHDTIVEMSREDHEQDRINHFKKSGYKCLIIWEEELKEVEKIIEKIIQFNKQI